MVIIELYGCDDILILGTDHITHSNPKQAEWQLTGITCPYKPLSPHFCVAKQEFTGIVFAPNIDCGYSIEPPGRRGSNVYPQSMFEHTVYINLTNIKEIFQSLIAVKIFILHVRVFVKGI